MSCRYQLIFIVVFVSFLLIGCKERSNTEKQLLQAEALIMEKPDSSLVILENIDTSLLERDKDKALYGLLQEVYPDFKANLRLLTQSRLTSLDLHTALLIKCHFTPTQMSVLLGRSKGTIVSRRETLSLKIFDEKIGTKVIDGIIRLL